MTSQQRRVLAFIKRCVKQTGFPPSRAEICRAFGFASPNAAQCHLLALEKRGAIKLTPAVARGIRVMEGGAY